MAQVETDKVRGAYVDPFAGRLLFRDYAEEWLRTRAMDESSREAAEYKVRKHLLPFFGARQLGAIKPGHIREWDRSMVGKLASSARSVIFAHLRSILSAAVDDERIVKNPCSARSVTQPRPAVKKIVPWDRGQVTAVRAGLLSRYQSLVDVGAGCGLRQGELFGIAVDDLDLDGGVLHVRRQVKRIRSTLVFGLPKNDRDRIVPLPGLVVRSLKQHMETCPPFEIALPWEDPASDKRVSFTLVFTSVRRHAISRSTFDEKSWKPALEKAGIPKTRENGMHALRHFYASVLLDGGESIKALSEYLGHHDPGFTLRTYTHLMPASRERTRNVIDDLFSMNEEVSEGEAQEAP